MKTIEQMIAVMTAYKDGKTIQWANAEEDDWEDCPCPLWDWDNLNYRVKQEPKVRPYENAKEFIDAMKEHGPFIARNGEAYYMALMVSNDRINYGNTWGSYDKLVEVDFKWQDGTPCGVEEGGDE